MAASQSPRRLGDVARVGEDSTPALAIHGAASPEQANLPRSAASDRCTPAKGAQTPGPCPHCGGYGPRIVLCHNPDCLHSQSMHALKKGDKRGACSVSTGPKATPCSCREYVPNPETP